MTRKRSNKRNTKPNSGGSNATTSHIHRNILQTNRLATYGANQNDTTNTTEPTIVDGISSIKSLLEDCKPSTSKEDASNSFNTELLYNELDSFRQKWKREIGEAKHSQNIEQTSSESCSNLKYNLDVNKQKKSDDRNKPDTSEEIYVKAKTLFLKAVDLEADEMHLESIRYYKEAMRLCPDIEKQIFQEQCAASVKENPKILSDNSKDKSKEVFTEDDDSNKIPIYDRICQSYHESNREKSIYSVCRPSHKSKGTHISDLPHELIMKIFYYIVGEELDLASLESTALTCRGFYLLSRDSLLWRSVCYQTWGCATISNLPSLSDNKLEFDWRQVYSNKPRVNFDGVYISKTRYVRLGDVGFTDLTYRPFHTVRYYRYLRFFPDRRVFILTTNEEPDKIVPIFRHAIHSKQFSSDLSILEGTFEFIGTNEIEITAEKDCTVSSNKKVQPQYWSRQTPLSQKLNLKFELKTSGKSPYKNDVLKWLEYTILTKLETGQELDSFDLVSDMFPNLIFSRVRRFNLKSTNPLSSQW